MRTITPEPPLARVGLSKAEAHAQGIGVRLGRLPISNVARTQATDEIQGFIKVLVGVDNRIIGFTMIGSEAGEIMAAMQTAMRAAVGADSSSGGLPAEASSSSLNGRSFVRFPRAGVAPKPTFRLQAPPAYSITSSAVMRSVFGTLRPRALAVFRFMANSNLVGCWAGRSAGFSPFRIRSA